MLRRAVMLVVGSFALVVLLMLIDSTRDMLLGEPEPEIIRPEIVRMQSAVAPGSQAQDDALPHERESFDFSQVDSAPARPATGGLAERVADLSAMTDCNIRFQDSARILYAAGALFRWTETKLEERFTQKRSTGNPNVTTYLGDAIEFLDEDGTWIRATYECDYDAAAEEIVDVRTAPGVLR